MVCYLQCVTCNVVVFHGVHQLLAPPVAVEHCGAALTVNDFPAMGFMLAVSNVLVSL